MTTEENWRKSSYSGGSGGDCVEVGRGSCKITVRDTKDSAGTVLRFLPEEWQRFVGVLKASGEG